MSAVDVDKRMDTISLSIGATTLGGEEKVVSICLPHVQLIEDEEEESDCQPIDPDETHFMCEDITDPDLCQAIVDDCNEGESCCAWDEEAQNCAGGDEGDMPCDEFEGEEVCNALPICMWADEDSGK